VRNSKLRPILNFAPRGKLWPQGRSCPSGVNFVPWRWSYPLGGNSLFAPSFFYINSRECSPLGVNKGVNIPPRGQISTLGPGVKLRMAFRNWRYYLFYDTYVRTKWIKYVCRFLLT
jgi:hypothetical protein